ncbi:MAG: efflux RND transporter periplasmic adaptor subunit [Salibacteraceae bacterium]
MKHVRNFKAIYLSSILLLPILVNCSSDNGKPADAPADLAIDILVAESQPFHLSIETTGEVMAFEEVDLKSAVSGNVMKIAFEEGQRVRKGDLLVKIDDRIWQAQLKGVSSQLKTAKSELNRSLSLLEIEGASQEDVDIAAAKVADLEAQQAQLEVNISLANVTAPFSGVVGFRDFSLGSYLTQGSVITRLSQIDKLKIGFEVPSKYSSQVKSGMKLHAVAENDTGSAVIYAVDPRINNETRSLGVRAEMTPESGAFKPGSFVRVLLPIVADSNAILLPTEAIVPELNSQSVFLLKNGKAAKSKIDIGQRTAESVQVISGIKVGDTVITSGLVMVREGMNLRAKIGQNP